MPLTPQAERAFRSQAVSVTPIELLTFTHPSFGVRRFCSNLVPFTSRGEEYLPAPFLDVKGTPNKPDQVPATDLHVGVNDQEIVAALRSIEEPPTITYEVVLAEDPDVVQDHSPGLLMEEVEMGLLRIRVTAGRFRIFQTLAPKLAYTPDRAPGAFV